MRRQILGRRRIGAPDHPEVGAALEHDGEEEAQRPQDDEDDHADEEDVGLFVDGEDAPVEEEKAGFDAAECERQHRDDRELDLMQYNTLVKEQ